MRDHRGGVIGCSLAYHLARDGRAPLVLERGPLGGGSTAACAGGFRQQFSTEVNVRVGMLSRRLLERFEDDVGAAPGLRQIGYLMVTTSEEQLAQFERNVAMQHRVGLGEVEMVPVDRLPELVPGMRVDDVRGATFCPTDGLAGPSEVTAGYAAAGRRLGAIFAQRCEVSGIDRDGDRITGVRTVAGELIESDLVINCAGPQAGLVGAMAGADVPVKPYRRHIFVTEPFSLGRPVPMTVDFDTSLYLHPEGPGMLLGMSDRDEPSSFDTTVAYGFLELLVERATWRVPALERASIQTGWSGLYEVTPDSQAIVGPCPGMDGFWLSCGFSGHGFMQAPAIGHLVAQMIGGRTPDVDLSALDPSRFARGELLPERAVI